MTHGMMPPFGPMTTQPFPVGMPAPPVPSPAAADAAPDAAR